MEKAAKEVLTQDKNPKTSEIHDLNIPGKEKGFFLAEEPKKTTKVQMLSKDTPEVTVNHLEGNKVQLVLAVEFEDSAKQIDIDVNSEVLKLESPNYELKHTFGDYKVDPDSVRCRFSKAKKTLTLTLDKA